MSITIVIPARYGSTRFPGKPLVDIAGKTMVQRVCEVAQAAAQALDGVSVLVATDDERIFNHVQQLLVPVVMTPKSCQTGTDRLLFAIQQLDAEPDYVINLQGDAPLTPVNYITALIDALATDKQCQVVTPVLPLTWQALDKLRHAKQVTPFSGTTAIVNEQEEAVWFSKNIIPAMRDEQALREQSELSPVYKHLGLYGYALPMLKTYVELAQTPYEQLEGLEQLRLLEHGYKIKAVKVADPGFPMWSGVDTPEDAKRVALVFKQYGELLL